MTKKEAIKYLRKRWMKALEREAELQTRLDKVENCVRYQTIVVVNGKQFKVECLLLDHVLAAMGYGVKERSLRQEQDKD